MPFTNAQHSAPATLPTSQWTGADGSPSTTGWSSAIVPDTTTKLGTRSMKLPASEFAADLSGRFGGTRYRTDGIVPVPAGALLNLTWRSYTRAANSQIIVVGIEFYGPSGQVYQDFQYKGTYRQNEWITQGTPFQIPNDGSVTGLKLMLKAGFVSDGETAGDVFIDQIRLHNHGRDKQAGQITWDTPPVTRRAFNSGNGEITVSATGAMRLNGQPFVMRAMFPDGDGNETSSFTRGMANGYNTAYQLNPYYRAQLLAPAGMKVVTDCTGYINTPATNGAQHLNFTRARADIRQLIQDKGDDYISVYIDTENEVWNNYGHLPDLIGAIRQAETDENSHKRPIFVHCQQFGGMERHHHLIDYFEFKDNPERSDFGTPYPPETCPNSSHEAYDRIQGAMGYGLAWHPYSETPYATFSFNTGHNGTRISGDIVDGVIKGGTGYSIWADRPRFEEYCGHNRGFENQPWWRTSEDIRDVHNQLAALFPMMEADSRDELVATFSANAQDGFEGVSKTLRKVGSEVWGAFANNSGTAKTITVTTSEDIDAGSLIDRFHIDTSAQITGTRAISVTLPAYTGYVGSFTVDGTVSTTYTLSTTTPACGTQSSPTAISAGQSTTEYAFTLNSTTGVSIQRVTFSRVNADGSLTELNQQAPATVETSFTATPTIDYIDGDLVRVDYVVEDASGAVLGTATPCFYLVDNVTPGTTKVRRCVTSNLTMDTGATQTFTLADMDDGAGGTPTRFVVVTQPSFGAFSVSADGSVLSVSLDADAATTTCGAVDVEYTYA